MQRFSIRSVLLLVVYFAVCSLVYVSTNIWFGWLVVFATAIVYATAMKRAFSTRDRSVLVFAISGTVALITMLGFAIETRGIPSQLKAHDLRRRWMENQWLLKHCSTTKNRRYSLTH